MEYDEGMQQALAAVGGPTKLAQVVGVVPSAVTQWKKIPAHHLKVVSKATGIPPQTLRPDLGEAFGFEPAGSAA